MITTIEPAKPVQAQAIASIRKYFEENMPEPIGELAAGLLLNFFLEEIGGAIYNRAIGDAQERMQLRVGDLSGDLYAAEFPYWPRLTAKRKTRL
ncbi:MAG TPA: DUF2164 domain-containing protein [Acidobacteriaceae bacterium]|jgi:uncharacterized protein (DUF2164 family)|nr:DUF2164 domain-containing protein [Acidobacteriaceae bacterium]